MWKLLEAVISHETFFLSFTFSFNQSSQKLKMISIVPHFFCPVRPTKTSIVKVNKFEDSKIDVKDDIFFATSLLRSTLKQNYRQWNLRQWNLNKLPRESFGWLKSKSHAFLEMLLRAENGETGRKKQLLTIFSPSNKSWQIWTVTDTQKNFECLQCFLLQPNSGR